MARYIEASYRNKKFLTSALEALEAGEVGSFTNIFAQHNNRAKYYQDKDAIGSTDLKLMKELIVNNPDRHFSRDEVQVLVAAFSKIPTISPETKACLYLESFTTLTQSEREAIFGKDGPLEFKSQTQNIKESFSAILEHHGLINSELGMYVWYFNSIEEGQLPEDFVEKFKLVQSFGVTEASGLKYLNYSTTEKETASEKYMRVLDAMPEDVRASALSQTPALISRPMLERYGVKALERCFQNHFSLRELSNVLLESFLADDNKTAIAVLETYHLNSPHTGVDEHIQEVLDAAKGLDLSESQKKILDQIEQHLKAANVRKLTEEIASGQFHAATNLVMSFMLDGNADGFRHVINELEGKDDQGFLSLMLSEIGKSLDYYVHQGLFGPEQKEVLELLSSKVMERTVALKQKISETSVDNNWRLRTQEEEFAVIPMSELTPEQRTKVIETKPAPREDIRRFERGSSLDPFRF